MASVDDSAQVPHKDELAGSRPQPRDGALPLSAAERAALITSIDRQIAEIDARRHSIRKARQVAHSAWLKDAP